MEIAEYYRSIGHSIHGIKLIIMLSNSCIHMHL